MSHRPDDTYGSVLNNFERFMFHLTGLGSTALCGFCLYIGLMDGKLANLALMAIPGFFFGFMAHGYLRWFLFPKCPVPGCRHRLTSKDLRPIDPHPHKPIEEAKTKIEARLKGVSPKERLAALSAECETAVERWKRVKLADPEAKKKSAEAVIYLSVARELYQEAERTAPIRPKQEVEAPSGSWWLWFGGDGRIHGSRFATLYEDERGGVEAVTFKRNDGEYEHVSGDGLKSIRLISSDDSDGAQPSASAKED